MWGDLWWVPFAVIIVIGISSSATEQARKREGRPLTEKEAASEAYWQRAEALLETVRQRASAPSPAPPSPRPPRRPRSRFRRRTRYRG